MKHGQPGKPIRNSAGLTSATAEQTTTGIPTAPQGGLIQHRLLQTATLHANEGSGRSNRGNGLGVNFAGRGQRRSGQSLNVTRQSTG